MALLIFYAPCSHIVKIQCNKKLAHKGANTKVVGIFKAQREHGAITPEKAKIGSTKHVELLLIPPCCNVMSRTHEHTHLTRYKLLFE
ncbi:hypothetical protein FKM82_006011 [Ascaphus truei]